MKITKLTLSLLVILNFYTIASAQNKSKAQFKTIEFAAFDVNSPRTKQKDSVEIFCYAIIDRKGKMSILNRDEDNDSLSYFKYQLDTAEFRKINFLFKDNAPLKDHMTSQSLKKGEHYGGSYSFLSVGYQNEKKDSLCFIDSYMSEDFQSALNILDKIFYGKSKSGTKAKFIVPINFKKSLQESLKKSNYLPPIEFPPPPL
jgi:hypothetical protein